jgi:hypothetical protein
VHGIYVLDRRTGAEISRDVVAPLARGVSLPDHCEPGTATAQHGGLRLQFTTDERGTRLRVSAPDVELDVVARRDPGHESMGVVVPWSRRLFQYTVKDLALPVSGRLVVRGEETAVEGPDALGVLDHGRGRWPYRMTWNWAAGSGAGGRAIQLGGTWTDGTGSTENAVLVDGRLHKIGEELRWEYDRTDWQRPWRISGATVDVRFHPFHERASRTNLGVVGSETHQCFGEFSGWATTDDGERVDLAGLVGWAEEARQRW